MDLLEQDTEAFRDGLEKTLQQCEREAGLQRMRLSIEAIAPRGLKVDVRVTLEPMPSDPGVACRTTEDVKRLVREFEAKTGCWMELVNTSMLPEPMAPGRWFSCTIRTA